MLIHILPKVTGLAVLGAIAPVSGPSPATSPTAPPVGVSQTSGSATGPAVPEDRPLRECSLDEAAQRAAPAVWDGGVVYFEFDANVTPANRTLMYEAMEAIHVLGARIAFVPRTPGIDDLAYIHILDSTVNSSAVGNQTPGQLLNVYNWGHRFIMAHELIHALGFWHEHTRWDRDTFVTIVPGNIQDNQAHNFTRKNSASWVSTATPYDFDSVMHYTGCAYSTQCPPSGSCNCSPGSETILVNPPNQSAQATIGQRNYISALDAADLRDAYGTGPRPHYMGVVTSGSLAGTLTRPFRHVSEMNNGAMPGSTVYVEAWTYDEGAFVHRIDRHLTIQPYGGVVRIQ